MSVQIRICPHCGAGVVGMATICPRCDQPLEGYPAEMAGIQTNIQQRPAETIFEEEETAVKALLPAETYTAPVPVNLIGITRPEDTQQQVVKPSPIWQIPPAPYTPPPLIPQATTSLVAYSYPSNYYFQQRVMAYQQGGYEMQSYSPYQAALLYGKPLGLLWWLIAMVSGVGLMWYLLILLASSFSRDRVYLVVERDGSLYEDGAGAAHVRRKRARVGQRWGFLGVMIFFFSLLWFVGMIVGGVIGVSRYRAELQAAYPTITWFVNENTPGTTAAFDPDTLSQVENGVMLYSVVFVLSVLGIITGLTLTIIGYLHSAAYRVDVPPLPEYI